MQALDVRRITLTTAIWFAGLYALCVLGHAIVGLGAGTGMYRFWEMFLIGFDASRPVSLLVGLGEALLYGALGGGVFALVYNAVPNSATPRPQAISGSRAQAGRL